MCGIAGIINLNKSNQKIPHNPHEILDLLKHRGPDSQIYLQIGEATLFHSRLSIIDTSEASNQPFINSTKTEALVFNGEIFNYQGLKLSTEKYSTSGDVEVLFKQLSTSLEKCLNHLNGFFAFAFYNAIEKTALLARDRYGVKPLYYFKDDNVFAFASELKPLLALIGKQELNFNQLYTYFRLNYSAGNETVFKNVYKLLPGQFIKIGVNTFEVKTWYQAKKDVMNGGIFNLLDDAVKIRLQADVPVGTFLSGGVDSSIISAIAKKHKPDLNTFSIGFEQEHYFDETNYSELVAKHINSNHHVYKLKEDDFLSNIDSFLNAIDEPFADSSAFNFYMLSKYTRDYVKVALSGDGADELFKGYNKHRALLLAANSAGKLLFKSIKPFITKSASSRDGALNNRVRQLHKLSKLTSLNQIEQQKFLATISSHEDCIQLLKIKFSNTTFENLFKQTSSFSDFELRDWFDIQTVLADDMLVKADRFSMQHGIEIRNPFLDYRIVNYALNLPESQKINKLQQKIILKQSFKHLLPKEIFHRSKKGFELPLQKWLSNELKTKLNSNWLNPEKIQQENLINLSRIEQLKQQVFSNNAGDSAAQLWAIIVFEAWLNNFKNYIRYA